MDFIPAALLSATLAAWSAPVPPRPEIRTKTTELFGERLVDDYHWLRDRKDPKVLSYLEAENAYTDWVMAPTKDFQEKLYQEMLSRIKETDVEVPYRKGGYFYYSRTEKGLQYPIHCRKRGGLDAPETVILDLNEMAQGQKYMSLGEFEVSDDGLLLAYTTDNVGFREYTLFVKDLDTGRLSPEKIAKVGTVAWAADNKTLFYTVEDHAKRQYRVYRHELGSDPAGDPLVYEEKDERFIVEISRSRSRALLYLESASHTTSEFRFLRSSDPSGDWRLISPRRQDHEYYPVDRGELFYIRTNRAGRNFQVMTAPVREPGEERWKELLPHRAESLIEDFLAFKGHCAIFERESGVPQLTVLADCLPRKRRRIEHPEPVYELRPRDNEEFDARLLRYRYQSMVTPPSVYDYDMGSGAKRLLKRKEVPGYRPEDYRSKRVYATAPDGVRIPISLLFRKDLAMDGKAGIYLAGYGSYGIPNPALFSSAVFSVVDRGAVFARAHVRGGGELGKTWHDQGRMRNKKNTFSDFIAAAEHLLKEGYGSGDKLVVHGGSAGGLLMGAVANMRPELFKGVVMDVPFVDVINTMLDESLPLTVGEFEEWG
ncbi:MAG: S9 family peptidase, partial [Elusimicrobia bacterium]|nr:S9 family peptidase [Elusimicrobiota bacterium]